jgi:AcrR family transcriptional regulator
LNDKDPISKREEQRLETRNRILQGATQLFLQSSIHEVSTNDIAERLNIAKGTIFHHFESKELLIREVILSVFAEEFYQLGKLLSNPELNLADLKIITKRMFHEFMEQPGFIKLLLDYSSAFIPGGDNSPEAKMKHSKLMEELFKPMVDMIPPIFVRFGIPKEKALYRTYLFLAALDGIGLYLYLDIIPNDHDYLDQLIDEFLEMLTQGA